VSTIVLEYSVTDIGNRFPVLNIIMRFVLSQHFLDICMCVESQSWDFVFLLDGVCAGNDVVIGKYRTVQIGLVFHFVDENC